MTNQDRIIALIRTVVPSLYGSFVAWAIGKIPAVQDIIDWLTATFEQDVVAAIEAFFVVACIAGFYWFARRVGAKWPALEKWLLGRSLVPIYETEGVYVIHSLDEAAAQLGPTPAENAALAAGETRKVQP